MTVRCVRGNLKLYAWPKLYWSEKITFWIRCYDKYVDHWQGMSTYDRKDIISQLNNAVRNCLVGAAKSIMWSKRFKHFGQIKGSKRFGPQKSVTSSDIYNRGEWGGVGTKDLLLIHINIIRNILTPRWTMSTLHKKFNSNIFGKCAEFCKLSFISFGKPMCLPFQGHLIHYNRVIGFTLRRWCHAFLHVLGIFDPTQILPHFIFYLLKM